MILDLKNKNALVTGASGGIGQSICQALSQAGARVILTGTNKEKLHQVSENLPHESAVLSCNLSDGDGVKDLVEKSHTIFDQPVDILVNNAGMTRDQLLVRIKDEDWENILNVNLTACFRLSKGFVKSMMKKRSGRIINITSLSGVSGNPGQTHYAASKAGMIGFSKSLAHEVARRGITVNCIAPGFIASYMTDVLDENYKKKICENIPMGQMGKPEDIAGAVVYLSSSYASYITGQTIHINGGMVMV